MDLMERLLVALVALVALTALALAAYTAWDNWRLSRSLRLFESLFLNTVERNQGMPVGPLEIAKLEQALGVAADPDTPYPDGWGQPPR